MKEKECKYCKEIIQYEKKQQLAAHVGNCKDNPKRKLSITNKVLERLEYNVNCIKCYTEYNVNVTETDFNKGNYRKCCTRKCANTKIVSQETKDKIRNSVKLNIVKPIGNLHKSCKVHFNLCPSCNNYFTTRKSYKQYCNRDCVQKSGLLKLAGHKAGLASVKSQVRSSKNEIVFAEFCKMKFNNVETNKSIFNGWDADVIIHDLKVAILWNGKWHYEKCNSKHSVKQVQNRDQIKIKEILNCGYTPYIIKDMGNFNLDKVQTEWILFNYYLLNKR